MTTTVMLRSLSSIYMAGVGATRVAISNYMYAYVFSDLPSVLLIYTAFYILLS